MKYKDNQPEGYPINLTFTDSGTQSVRDFLNKKLENASSEDKAHYENELKYFKKHATSETGKEGDGDTAIIYEDEDGRMRVVYVTNKQTLSDPHSNATVKSVASAAKSVKNNSVEGSNSSAINKMVDDSVADAVEFNKTYTKNMRGMIDQNKEHLNKSPLTKIATQTLTGRAEFTDKTSRKYVENTKKSEVVQKYAEKYSLDLNDDGQLVEAALAVVGTGDADEVNDSNKQAANKLALKITNSTSSVRIKMQRLIN